MKFGGKEDQEAIQYAICCGIKGIFTAHGSEINELEMNPCIECLMKQNIFERIIFLDDKKKGIVKQVYKKDIDEKGQALLVPM